MCIVLANGYKCFYDIGVDSEDVERTFERFCQMIPHGDFEHIGAWNQDDRSGGVVKKILKERYGAYINLGNTVEYLVNN